MKKALTWVGIVLASILILLVLAGAVLYILSGSKMTEVVAVPAETMAIPADSAGVAWGAHLVQTHACRECHGENLGGQVFIDAPPFLIVASNLTSGTGGVGARYTPEDWEHAIRHGVKKEGRGLAPMMPSKLFSHLSEEDMGAMIAYLQQVPPVDNELPPTELRALGRVIVGTGGLPFASDEIDHDRPHGHSPELGPTVEYGAYRASTTCNYCHGEKLQGGPSPSPDGPLSPSLGAVKGWSLDQFVQALRTGVTPAGRTLDATSMPWGSFQHMTDEELEALYKYIQSLSFTEQDA